jgi:hypothetical protein
MQSERRPAASELPPSRYRELLFHGVEALRNHTELLGDLPFEL